MNNSTKQFKIATFVNITSQDVAGLYPQFMYESVLKLATGKPDLKFKVTNTPFPLTQSLSEQEKTVSGVFIVLVISVAYAMVSASTIAFICYEKEKSLKQQQLVQGMSLLSYWLTNFTFDILKTHLLSGMTIILLHLFNFDMPDIWIILLIYPFALIPFTYATSMFFSKESSAQNCTIFVHVFISSIGAGGVFMMRMVKQTENQGDLLSKIFRFLPSFAFSQSMLYSTSRETMNETRNYTESDRL